MRATDTFRTSSRDRDSMPNQRKDHSSIHCRHSSSGALVECKWFEEELVGSHLVEDSLEGGILVEDRHRLVEVVEGRTKNKKKTWVRL